MTGSGGDRGPGWDRTVQNQTNDWASEDPGRSGLGVGVVVAVGAVVLVVIALVVALVVLVGGSGGDGDPVAGNDVVTVTSTASATEERQGATETETVPETTRRNSPPSGLVEQCSDAGDTALPRSGTGSAETSCAFAISVRDAYLDSARPGEPATVEAYSSVTGQGYSMACMGGRVITCRGGNNAVVHLY